MTTSRHHSQGLVLVTAMCMVGSAVKQHLLVQDHVCAVYLCTLQNDDHLIYGC